MKLLLTGCEKYWPPKWSLLSPKGYPMLYESVRGLKLDPSDIIVGILREHEDALGATNGIHRMLGEEVRVLVFEEPTKGQPETIFKMLEIAEVKEDFLVKDTDNLFFINDEIPEQYNYICVESLNNFQEINLRRKYYVQLDSNQLVTHMDEKVISSFFCVGGFYFTEAELFCKAYQKLVSQVGDDINDPIHISDIVNLMRQDDIPFLTKKVQSYIDWGTAQDWHNFHKRFRTYFVNVDGVIFERGSPFFSPTYREVKPNLEVVTELLNLLQEGSQIIFLSERDEGWRMETELALTDLGFTSLKLIMNCHNSQHVLVNACSSQLPYSNARAVNLLEKENQITSMLLRGE